MSSKKFFEDVFQDYIDGNLSSNDALLFEASLTEGSDLKNSFTQYKNLISLEKKLREASPKPSDSFISDILKQTKSKISDFPLSPVNTANYVLTIFIYIVILPNMF